MTAAAVTTLNVKQAEKMWADLKGHFVNAEKTIIQIIQARAWEPLGYDSFVEAWQEKMAGVRLASTELRAHVVYAMFDEGLSEAGVNDVLGVGSGIGPSQVKVLKRQKLNGVPAAAATCRVPAYERRLPCVPRRIHVEFQEDEYADFFRIATALELNVHEVAASAVRAAFADLAGQ
ncbi:hypothetical protein ACIGKR_12360 [Rhodococcus qingshengii]|uniref:hypothetical protein n=1 Tax=Rhodococcus qingshengii TaxID=334542 RepID=UPI0037C90469